ncbi:MAG: glycosyltransferase [Bacteroidota bacterium]|nr:glycosyltransferase [Bacteroidota bacterium]
MKLLVILSRVPYPVEKGDKLRAYHQLRCLSARHEIHLITLNDEPLDPDAEYELKKFCKSVHVMKLRPWGMICNLLWAFFTGRPLQIGYFHRFYIKKEIRSLIAAIQPDHLYCQLARTAEYAIGIDIPKTIDYQDVFSIGLNRRLPELPFWKRPFFEMEAHRMAAYEEAVFNHFNHHTIIAYPDRNLLPFNGRDKVLIVPNGVDFSYFVPDNETEKRYDLVFTGNMSYPPNIMAVEFLVRKILPVVWESRPSTNLLIAGTTPHFKVRSLSESRILVTGWLKDMRTAYSASRIFIAPMLIGTGLQNKLLEAMAMNLPCITSKLANEALVANPGEEVLVAENPTDYARHILTLLNDPGKARQISENGFRFVKSHYDWEAATALLAGLLENTN